MSDQTYDDGRSRNLERMLRSLADRIHELDQQDALLRHTVELTTLIGAIRSELFHYEVRVTYDTPEVAKNRRIVAEALRDDVNRWGSDWTPDDDED